MKLTPPVPIASDCDLQSFDCGNADLNDWLRNYAHKNEALTARTYVVCVDNRVVGFYSLAMGSVFRADMPNAKTRKGPDSIPVAVIGRVATDIKYQGMGIGAGMLKDAFSRCLEAAERIGMRAVVVHAKDDALVAYYQQYGFLISPTDPRTLILPVDTIRNAVR